MTLVGIFILLLGMKPLGAQRRMSLSAADNAFMYSVIESCKHNDIDPGKYISFLLGKLKTAGDGDDLTGLLPCYCGL